MRLTDRIGKVASQVMGEIEQVLEMIGSAAGSASNYTDSLDLSVIMLSGVGENGIILEAMEAGGKNFC